MPSVMFGYSRALRAGGWSVSQSADQQVPGLVHGVVVRAPVLGIVAGAETTSALTWRLSKCLSSATCTEPGSGHRCLHRWVQPLVERCEGAAT